MRAIPNILAALILASHVGAQTELLDQRHDDPDAYETHRNIKAHAPVAQEFTPALGALDFIEIWTRDIGTHDNQRGASLRIVLRNGGLEGEIIGVSSTVVLPDGHNDIARFEFADWIPLEIGALYTLELEHLEGDHWAVHSHGSIFPPYDGGRYYLQGEPVVAEDMWFRTGARHSPRDLRLARSNQLQWKGIPPLEYQVWESHDLRAWEEAGRVSSRSLDHALTLEEPPDGRPRFFRVTAP